MVSLAYVLKQAPVCLPDIFLYVTGISIRECRTSIFQMPLWLRYSSSHLNSPHALQTIALHRGWKVFGSQEQDVGLRQIEKGFLNIYFTTTDPMTPPLLSHTREKIGVTTGYTAPPSFPYLQ